MCLIIYIFFLAGVSPIWPAGPRSSDLSLAALQDNITVVISFTTVKFTLHHHLPS
jgi:hypothetical protein